MRIGPFPQESACHAQIHGCCAALRRTAGRVSAYTNETWDMRGTWIFRLLWTCSDRFFSSSDADRKPLRVFALMNSDARPRLDANVKWLYAQYGAVIDSK